MLDRDHLGLLDMSVRATPSVASWRPSRPTSTSRASRCTRSSSARPGSRRSGDEVEVLAEVDGHPVAVRQGNILAVAFHPELTDERRAAPLACG